MEILSHLLTVVLDDAFEVVGHQVPQGTFVGQTQTVREHDGRVYDWTVDQLEFDGKTEKWEWSCDIFI